VRGEDKWSRPLGAPPVRVVRLLGTEREGQQWSHRGGGVHFDAAGFGPRPLKKAPPGSTLLVEQLLDGHMLGTPFQWTDLYMLECLFNELAVAWRLASRCESATAWERFWGPLPGVEGQAVGPPGPAAEVAEVERGERGDEEEGRVLRVGGAHRGGALQEAEEEPIHLELRLLLRRHALQGSLCNLPPPQHKPQHKPQHRAHSTDNNYLWYTRGVTGYCLRTASPPAPHCLATAPPCLATTALPACGRGLSPQGELD